MRIHFILAANNSSSQTRVTVEYANRLVRRGHTIIVSVPRFDFFDFVCWKLRRDSQQRVDALRRTNRFLHWLVIPYMRALLICRPWFAKTGHKLDPRVRIHRYLAVPTEGNMPDADVVVALQCYLLGHLALLTPRKGKVVSSIRLDYQAGTAEPAQEIASWREFCVSFYRRFPVPLFAVSRRAKESANGLGIPVGVVIPNGVNTEEFTDSGRRGNPQPLRVTLFVQDHPQKGQDFGCALIRRLRELPLNGKVLYCTVGNGVKPEHRALFDFHYGYLTGEDYPRMYRQTDILVFPSQYEGFPAIPLEAMASGCAVATTLVSGVDEYALHEQNCMVCSPVDIDGMVHNVRRLISDVRLRDTLRDNGVATARRYTWEKATDRLEAFLKGLPAEETKEDPWTQPLLPSTLQPHN